MRLGYFYFTKSKSGYKIMPKFAEVIWIPFIIAIVSGIIMERLGHSIFLSSAFLLILILPLYFFDRIRYAFLPNGGVKVDGKWKSTWTFQKDSQEIAIHDTISLKQFGSFIWGKAESHSVSDNAPFPQFNYSVRAIVRRDRKIEGSWTNRDDRRKYYGVFLAVVSLSSRSVDGKWLGTNSDGVGYGNWKWAFIG